MKISDRNKEMVMMDAYWAKAVRETIGQTLAETYFCPTPSTLTAESEVPSCLEGRSSALQSPELWCDALRSFYSTKPPAPSTKTLRE